LEDRLQIFVKAGVHLHAFMGIQALPSRWYNSSEKCWEVLLHPIFLSQLQQIGIQIPTLAIQRAQKREMSFKPKSLFPKILKVIPRSYQRVGIGFIDQCQGICLIGDDTGTGKTLQAIAWMAHKKAYPALIVCPATLKLNWEREIKNLIGKSATILSGTPDKGTKLSSDIVIINYDILTRWKPVLTKHQFKLAILDEAHYLKNSTAQRTKTAVWLTAKIPHRIGLTATPVENGPMDLFTIFKILRPSLFPVRHNFGLRYCGAQHTPWGWKYNGASNLNELSEILRLFMIRRRKKDILKELPDTQRIILPIAINRKEYEQAEAEFFSWYSRGGRIKLHALQKMEAMRQAVNKAKFREASLWIADFIENNKLVLFVIHTKMAQDFYQLFKKQAVLLYGKTPAKQRQQAIDQFQNDDKTRLFIANIKAGGVGVTLTAADTTCCYELPWTSTQLEQAEGRVSRIGQTSDKLTSYFLLTPDTIEMDLMEIIDRKQKLVSQIVDQKFVEENDIFEELIQRIHKRVSKKA
jgi:SWI/SNF-related matrix-associated actin-dependent regulator 1 of chromatin subfamily A